MIPDKIRLRHILDAIAKIEDYSKRNRGEEMTRDAIIYQLAVIGEAVRHLSPGLRKAHPDVPWKAIVGLRNLIIHEYYIISHHRIWNIVDNDIPAFMPNIEAIVNHLP